MSYNNRFYLGVHATGYVFLSPPLRNQVIPDDEALELAALIVAMKPQLRERFDQRLKEIESHDS